MVAKGGDHAVSAAGRIPAARRSSLWRRSHLWLGVTLLTALAVHSWLAHVAQLQRLLSLEASEAVQLADALAAQHRRTAPASATPERRADGGRAGHSTPPGDADVDSAALARDLAARLGPPTGRSLLLAADGRVLLARGRPPPLTPLEAAPLPSAATRGWLEGRSHSELSGIGSVSSLDFADVLALWLAQIAFPGGLLLAGGALLLLVSGRLEVVRDELRQASRHALQDALTGLPNRRAFDGTYQTLSRASVRDRRPLSLLFIDIDRFKQLNDRFGHAAGDRALRAIAGAIRSSLLRPTDFCCRWGGEEFVVVLPDTEAAGALETAQRIIGRVRGLHPGFGHPHGVSGQPLTVSVGIASHASDAGAPGQELVLHADSAMLQAKRGGRDRWVVWRDEPPDTPAQEVAQDMATAPAASEVDAGLCALPAGSDSDSGRRASLRTASTATPRG